jgi:rhodanese-related sulfurtransferase
VLILYCRTGGRSSAAGAGVDDLGLGVTVYEIDIADPNGGHGGFSGSPYKNAYNGYVGFPGRPTGNQQYESASWLDAGLPVTTQFRAVP